jgi:hypothetical protein
VAGSEDLSFGSRPIGLSPPFAYGGLPVNKQILFSKKQ